MVGATLLTIPYQAFEVDHVYLTPFQMNKNGKCIAQLTYKDHSIDFQDVSLMTPPLRIVDYDPHRSCLRLDVSNHLNFYVKLNMFYDYLVSTFYLHQQGFLHMKHRTMEDIRQMFYSLLDGQWLSIYIYPTTMVCRADGSSCRISEMTAGEMVRCVIRFQGVSQIHHREGMKLRLHHSVPMIWAVQEGAGTVTK